MLEKPGTIRRRDSTWRYFINKKVINTPSCSFSQGENLLRNRSLCSSSLENCRRSLPCARNRLQIRKKRNSCFVAVVQPFLYFSAQVHASSGQGDGKLGFVVAYAIVCIYMLLCTFPTGDDILDMAKMMKRTANTSHAIVRDKICKGMYCNECIALGNVYCRREPKLMLNYKLRNGNACK